MTGTLVCPIHRVWERVLQYKIGDHLTELILYKCVHIELLEEMYKCFVIHFKIKKIIAAHPAITLYKNKYYTDGPFFTKYNQLINGILLEYGSGSLNQIISIFGEWNIIGDNCSVGNVWDIVYEEISSEFNLTLCKPSRENFMGSFGPWYQVNTISTAITTMTLPKVKYVSALEYDQTFKNGLNYYTVKEIFYYMLHRYNITNY